MIEILLIILGIYLLTVVISWYPMVADLSDQFYAVWPNFEDFRERVSLSDIMAGTFFALIPAVNIIFILVFMFGAWMNNHGDSYPLRRKK